MGFSRLAARWREFWDEVRRHPTGSAAVFFALAAVAVPAAVAVRLSPARYWRGDTLAFVPSAAQTLRTGGRDLSRYVRPDELGRPSWRGVVGGGNLYFVRTVPTRPGYYSSYPAGVELFVWPEVVAAWLLGQDLDDQAVQDRIEYDAAAVAAGLSLALFFLTALHLGPPSAAAATTLLLATGSVYFSLLGLALWQHTGVVFWISVALLVELRSGGRPGRAGTAVQALACALMLACRPSAVTFLVPFGLWVLARDRRRGLLLPALAAVMFLPWAALYWSIYRQPLGPSTSFLAGADNWTPLRHVPDVLFSPSRGLLVYQTWVLLLPLLLFRGVRTDPVRPTIPGWYAFALGYLGCHVLLIGSWWGWWGGMCWGSRLVAEVVPVAGLLAVRPVAWLLRGWAGRVVLLALFVLGLALHAPAVYGTAALWNGDPTDVDFDNARLWDWSDPPFLYPLRR